MVKRKKEFRGDEALASAARNGEQAQTGTNEEANSCPKVPGGLDERVEMKRTESESGSVPESGAAPTADSEEHVHVPVPARPPVNHPFLRSSVKRKKKEPTPPPSPPKPDETEKTEAKPDRKRCWEAWSDGETTLFFEAVNEYGKDFDAIQKYIEQRHKKLGLAAHQVKNKNQVRHLYYRTCHKLFSFINPKPDQEKTVSELFALINFGELRKKLNLKGGITRRVGQRLNQLVNSGQTVIRVRGMNRRVKTPLCKALRRLKGDENKSDPYKLPAQVLMELQPRSNKAWAAVQGMAHNPRVRLVISLKKNLGSIISYLNDKWTPHRAKLLNTLKPTGDKQDTLRLRLVLSEGLEVTPHNQVTGRYMHSDSRAVFSLDTEARVTKAVAASKAAKIQRAAATMSLARAPGGTSLDCTKDVPGLEKMEKANCDGNPAGGKPTRKYKPRKKAKLSVNDAGDQEGQPVPIIVSNHRRKSEDAELMELGQGDGLKSPVKPDSSKADKVGTEDMLEGNVEEETIPLEELKWTIAPEKEITKDEQLAGVLSADNSKNLTMTDIYLMLNMPTRLKFEYEFVSADGGSSDDSPPEKPKLLNRLLEVASTEFTDIRKPRRSISVGTVTSPPRFNSMLGTSTTPPSKASFISQLSRSPGNGRGQRSTMTNGVMRVNSRPAAKPSAGAKDKDSSLFLTPAIPTSQPQALVSVESATTAAEKLFMAQIESLQKQPFPKPNSRRGRKPLVVQRTLLPRPQSEHKGPTRHMMSMSKTGQFTPVQMGIPDSLNQRPVLRPVPIAPGPGSLNLPSGSTSMMQSASSMSLASASAEGTASPMVSYALSAISSSGQPTLASPLSASSPDLSLAMSTLPTLLPGGTTPMNEIEAASAAAGIDTTLRPSPTDPTRPSHSPPIGVTSKPAMLNPSPQAIDDTMEIVSVTPCGAFGASGAGVGLGAVGSVGPAFDIFPPNLSLLDISLPSPAANGGGDSLMDMPMGTEAFTGFNQQLSPSTSNPSVMLPSMSPLREHGASTPPLNLTSPSSSPFKLSSLSLDNQWLNGESVDISLSSLLGHLESPEKKERQSIMTSSGSLTIPLPSLLCESSRDSSISKDVDTHLQYMMNENSVEYVAKFADLTAHIITAHQEAQKETTVRH